MYRPCALGRKKYLSEGGRHTLRGSIPTTPTGLSNDTNSSRVDVEATRLLTELQTPRQEQVSIGPVETRGGPVSGSRNGKERRPP